MVCNCKLFEGILGVIILFFALWPALLGIDVSKWIIVVAAIALLIHACRCKAHLNVVKDKRKR